MPLTISKDPSPRPTRPEEDVVKLRMTQTTLGSPDGIEVREYVEGETYDVPDSLAEVFLSEKWATKPGRKSDGPAPEDKALQGAPEDKAEPKQGRRGRRS